MNHKTNSSLKKPIIKKPLLSNMSKNENNLSGELVNSYKIKFGTKTANYGSDGNLYITYAITDEEIVWLQDAFKKCYNSGYEKGKQDEKVN